MGNQITCNILLDYDRVDDRLTSAVDSYRLLVGAAEELTRTPSATEKIICDSLVRAAFMGNIIDQLLIIQQIALVLEFLDLDDEVIPDVPNPFI